MFLFPGERKVLRVLIQKEDWLVTGALFSSLDIVRISESSRRRRDRLRRGSVYVFLYRLKKKGLVSSRSETESEYHSRLASIVKKRAPDWKIRTFYFLTERGQETAKKLK